jgi:hypothetical protein
MYCRYSSESTDRITKGTVYIALKVLICAIGIVDIDQKVLIDELEVLYI